MGKCDLMWKNVGKAGWKKKRLHKVRAQVDVQRIKADRLCPRLSTSGQDLFNALSMSRHFD